MKRAFTLIEVLVVVGIIALLAAILFPAFTAAREKARSASCGSNLRQLGQSMQMYLQDYERYPHAVDPADKYAPQIWQTQAIANGFDIANMELLHHVMQPYVKSAAIWRCPSDTGFEQPDHIQWQLEGEPTRPSCYEKYGTSYFYRTELMFRTLLQDSLPRATEINVLMDAHGAWHGASVTNLWNGRRYNVLFADGHVKNIDRTAFDAAWDVPLQ